MKHIILSLVFLFSVSANAQSYNWKLVPISDSNKNVVGFIYHTESIGRQTGATPEKVQTGLRLACSKMNNEDAMLILHWEGLFGNIPTDVNITVDGRKIGVGQSYKWARDNSVLFRPIDDSGEILRALKIGRSVNFSWTDSGNVVRTTVFDLRTFNSNLSNFNSSCNLSI